MRVSRGFFLKPFFSPKNPLSVFFMVPIFYLMGKNYYSTG